MVFLTGLVSEAQPWSSAAKAAVRPFAEMRLAQLARALGEREWLEDAFTIGDLLMIDVLRAGTAPDLLAPHANLLAYVERGTSRPAFRAALEAQLASFKEAA